MRKGLAVGAVLASLVMAGCGSGESAAPNTGTGPTQAPSTGRPQSNRAAPAKSVEIADKCSIVPESQWRALGADQPPRQRDSDGQLGCNYQKGEAGSLGWGAFVALGNTTFNDEVEARNDPTKKGDVSGYPVAEYDSGLGCVLFADVSDRGHLIVNVLRTSPDDPGINMCQQAEKFAQAAIQNLPNA